MPISPPTSTTSPWWLRAAGVVSLSLLTVLLTLGSLVTSFRVGMADPLWPTEPWYLFTMSWREPSPGFLIEHAHRLAGFIVGMAMTLFALLAWLTEPNRGRKWFGIVSLILLLAAFGQMHGTLIKHQRLMQATGDLGQPNWLLAAGPTTFALAWLLVAIIATWIQRPSGWRVRTAVSVLLIAVMLQGLLGGLRVYLNALLGTDIAAVHGVFSQLVLALHVIACVLSVPVHWVPLDDRWTPDATTLRFASWTCAGVFAQIVAGSLLRHGVSTAGPRLHQWFAFIATLLIVGLFQKLHSAPWSLRTLSRVLAIAVAVQIALGVEAWLTKFDHGTAAAAWQPITPGHAAIRTLHTLTGYALFALTVAITTRLHQLATPATRPVAARQLEGVA